MADYSSLERIIQMKFSDLRAASCKDSSNMRATDEAISLLVNNLRTFFSQFKDIPSEAVLREFECKMDAILVEINKSEYEYYFQKYSKESPEGAAAMARQNAEVSISKLSKRMQYWAAAADFGDTIRNPQMHRLVVEDLDKWANALARLNKRHSREANKVANLNVLFNAAGSDPDDESSAACAEPAPKIK